MLAGPGLTTLLGNLTIRQQSIQIADMTGVVWTLDIPVLNLSKNFSFPAGITQIVLNYSVLSVKSQLIPRRIKHI